MTTESDSLKQGLGMFRCVIVKECSGYLVENRSERTTHVTERAYFLHETEKGPVVCLTTCPCRTVSARWVLVVSCMSGREREQSPKTQAVSNLKK